MTRIAVETEKAIARKGFELRRSNLPPSNLAEVIAENAYQAARQSQASGIVVFTTSGNSARVIARFRSPVELFAVTPNESVARQLTVCYGVTPIHAPYAHNSDQMMAQMDRMLLERGVLKLGDTVVFVAGQPVGRPGTMNLLKLHRVGETLDS
jgi:pyruvate kinase